MIQPKKNWPIENRAIAAAVKYQSPLKNRKEKRPQQMQSEIPELVGVLNPPVVAWPVSWGLEETEYRGGLRK